MAESTDPFNDPGSSSQYPSLKQLKDRLLIVQPTAIEKGLSNPLKPGEKRDRITADVHVLDGDVITSRIDQDDNETPLDEPLTPPFKLADMYLSGAKMLGELKGSLPQGDKAGGLVIGVLTKLLPQKPGQKGAWSLRQATPEEKAKGNEYWKNLDVFAG